jgi:hypothetical protein
VETIEYRTVDKSQWGDGPWQNEPDKKQWRDPETGLPCLIVRGPSGALCGYVGVTEGHPFYKVAYSHYTSRDDGKIPEADTSPEAQLSVHGGITFSRGCEPVTEADYARMLKNVAGHKAAAAKHPLGDAAEWLQRWLPHLGSYEAYRERAEAEYICHKAAAEDKVWWFGFDCAHAGDVSPKMREWEKTLGLAPRYRDGDVYRDMAYVTEQVTSLAKQLAAVK